MTDHKKFRSSLMLFCLLALSACTGCGTQAKDSTTIASEYQAVFLDNGQVFFGKLESASAEYAVLRDVYYVQAQRDSETSQVKNILIKRGHEWHSPDVMYINSRHIVVIESVSPTSKVARLISEAKNSKPADTP